MTNASTRVNTSLFCSTVMPLVIKSPWWQHVSDVYSSINAIWFRPHVSLNLLSIKCRYLSNYWDISKVHLFIVFGNKIGTVWQQKLVRFFFNQIQIQSTDSWVGWHSETWEDRPVTCLYGPHTVSVEADKHAEHTAFLKQKWDEGDAFMCKFGHISLVPCLKLIKMCEGRTNIFSTSISFIFAVF